MFSLDQYNAARHAAALDVAPSRGVIALTGDDRRSFLHALVTNDVATLENGRGTYAAYLTPQGRMISDMRVIEAGGRTLLGVERSVVGPLAERLDKLIFSEDVQVVDLSSEIAEVGVHGPLAADIIGRVTAVRVDDLQRQYDNIASPPLTIVRDDAFGVTGFSVYVPRVESESFRKKLVTAGAMDASDETFEALRIEAGRPRFGVDMSTDTIPLEAGIEDRAMSFTKGCYVGQEVIIRVVHRGHGRVARRLVRMVLPGGTVPSRGDKILAAGQQVGEITSAAESPKAGAPMAMGYVHRDHTAPGAELTVNGSQAVVYQPGD